ncbi:MAG: serine/threonine protein kinase [Planctomycetes bacterium]|nr:serine/threonine protein kinase [Planctomycetota bacterium]
MNELKCLSEQELSEFVQGRSDDVLVDQIAEHLEVCDDCQATIVMLGENSDTFVEQLRSPAVPDVLEAEEACQDAVERLADRAANWRSGPTATLEDIEEIQQLGPYRIRGELGVGGMGTVYEAVHEKLKRTVALKILPASRWTNPLAIARFEREMEVIGQLDHPNIVRAHDAGEEHGMHYLVMEHVDGLDLSRIVNRVGRLATADACEIARQAAIGLQYANENHLVHRDIKPSNLMLARAKGQESSVESQNGDNSSQPSTRDSRLSTSVKILDLGLALLGEAHAGYEDELTTVGQLMGTLDYMSPEQGMDSHEVDTRADIYSLGATLFKLLTGRAPFASPQYNTLLKKVTALANNHVTPIQELRPDIPSELASIIDRMLSKEPADRFNTPNELAVALEPFARGADLGGLLAAALKVKEPERTSLPPVIASRNIAPTRTPLMKASAADRNFRGWKFVGLGIAMMFFAFAAGIVVFIQTDKGQLIVRAEDNAQILVRKDGNTVRQLEVFKGELVTTIRSGAYRIELKGESDQLMMSQNTVTVKRGDRIVVHVQHRPKATAMDAMGTGGDLAMMEGEMGAGIDTHEEGAESRRGGADMSAMHGGGSENYGDSGGMVGGEGYGGAYGAEGSLRGRPMVTAGFGGSEVVSSKPDPTYDGKTYTQWLSELESERKPERLTEAIRAFASLGDDDQELATQSVAVIMKIMRRNGSNAIDKSPQGMLIQEAQSVLLQMPGEIVTGAIEIELREGNTRSRKFVNMLLGVVINGFGSPSADFVSAVARRREPLHHLLLTLPDDEAADVRANAIALVVTYANSNNLELAKVEGLIPRLQATLNDKDLKLVTVGTNTLVKLDPDNKELVAALVRLLRSNNYGYRINAARLLGRLGARSQVAVNHLIEIIKPLSEPNTKSPGAADDYGSFGGGGAPGMSQGYGGGGYGGGYGGAALAQSQDIYHVTIKALGLIGPNAKAALPVLRKVAEATPTVDGLAIFGDDEGNAQVVPGSGGRMGDAAVSYIAAARTAINRIEGKEPIPLASEQEEAESSATRSGGFF